jgi:hypothetical protein
MAQLSRPYQIALGALVVLGLVWFFVIRQHPPAASKPVTAPAVTVAPTPSTPATTPAKSASTVSSGAKSASAGKSARTEITAAKKAGKVLSGVAGIHRATANADAAVKAKTPATTSRHAATATSKPATASKPAGKPTVTTAKPTVTASTPAAAAKPATSKPAAHANPSAPALAVKQELATGKVAVILFWNPKGYTDREVNDQLSSLGTMHGRLAVHVAKTSQVSDFGTITTGVSVLQTPTILVLNPKGQISTITGLVDSADIRATITQAEQGPGAVQLPTLADWVAGSTRSHFIASANKVCRENVSSQLLNAGSTSALQVLRTVDAVATMQLDQIKRLATPTSDRTYLHALIALVAQSITRDNQGLSEAGGGNAYAARADFLQAQAEVDQGSHGLAAYGLTACFPLQADN